MTAIEMTAARVRERRKWFVWDVRQFCITHHLYTAGDSRAYDAMLQFVKFNPPTTANLFAVANDIVEHSSGDWNISNVMFLLAKEACFSVFTCNDEDTF